MTESLPEICQQLVRAYLGLDFGDGRLVQTPYFKNSPKKKRFTNPVDGGKGAPHEIIAEVRARAILKRIRLNDLDTAQIRELMITEGIGVDCSGLAGRILDALVKERVGKSIAQCLQPVQINGHSPLRRIIFRFRPLQNIDVLTLTSEMNCISVTLSDLRPGDLIRTRGGKHVLLITEIERHDNRIMSFAYVHSSGQFGDQSGVREGKVVITNVDGNLGDQDWQEVWEGRKPALEGWREEREKNGIHRLRALI